MRKVKISTWDEKQGKYVAETIIYPLEPCIIHIKSKPVVKEKKKDKGEIKGYPAIFTKKARKMLDHARENDGCTACGTKELLQVHHIDHDKFNNDDENLIVLCYYCHAKEHKHMQNKKPPKWLK